jgi:hypothetical protein
MGLEGRKANKRQDKARHDKTRHVKARQGRGNSQGRDETKTKIATKIKMNTGGKIKGKKDRTRQHKTTHKTAQDVTRHNTTKDQTRPTLSLMPSTHNEIAHSEEEGDQRKID